MYDLLIDKEQFIQTRTLDFAFPGSPWMATPTWSGMAINEDEVFQCPPVTCGIRCITEDLAALPCVLYDYDDETGNMERDTDNPYYHRLLSEPNPEMDMGTLIADVTKNAILYGDGICEIQWKNDASDFMLWPVEPRYFRIYRDSRTGKCVYQITRQVTSGPPGVGTDWIDSENIIHIIGLVSYQGLVGQGLIHIARNTIGNHLAQERYEGSLWKNAPKPSGVLERTMPVQQNESADQNMAKSFEDKATQREAGHVPVVPYGFTYKSLELTTPEQLQMTELQEAKVRQIARFLRLHPTKCMDLQDATWANSKEFNKQHWNESIRPWALKWERALSRKLLSKLHQRKKRIRFDTTDILRADPLTFAQVAQIALGNQAYMSANEVRAQLGLPNMGPQFDSIAPSTTTNQAIGEDSPLEETQDDQNENEYETLTTTLPQDETNE